METPENDRVENDIDATAEQLAELRQLGVREIELEGLSYADAEAWLDQLRAQRIDAGRP